MNDFSSAETPRVYLYKHTDPTKNFQISVVPLYGVVKNMEWKSGSKTGVINPNVENSTFPEISKSFFKKNWFMPGSFAKETDFYFTVNTMSKSTIKYSISIQVKKDA